MGTAIMSGSRLSPSRMPASKPAATMSLKGSSTRSSSVTPGIGFAEGSKARREQPMRGKGRNAQAQIAGDAVIGLLHRIERQIDLAESRTKPLEQQCALFRHGDAARRPGEQPHAQGFARGWKWRG